MAPADACALVATHPLVVRWAGESLQVSPEVEGEVARLWEEGRRARPLHDGRVLAFSSLEGTTLWTRAADYRYFVAQRAVPALRQKIGVEPVAVSGLLHVSRSDSDAYAVAQRAPDVTEYPEHWELIPSGGLDASSARPGGAVDVEGQLLRELDEEAGISGDAVLRLEWIGLFRDALDGVWDLAYEIIVSSPPRARPEYRALRLLTGQELAAFARAEAARFVPTSLGILRARHLVEEP